MFKKGYTTDTNQFDELLKSVFLNRKANLKF